MTLTKLQGAVLLTLSSVIVSGAWPFSSSKEAKEREVCVLSPMATNAFVQLATARSNGNTELLVLDRLSREKKAELASFDETLKISYGMDPRRVYTFDSTNRTINLVESQTLDKNGKIAPAKKTAHRVFPDDATCDEFIRVVVAKQMTLRHLEVFNELVREKTLEVARVNEALKQRYKIDPSRKYRFEAKSRKLFEVVPPNGSKPTTSPVGAKKIVGSAKDDRLPVGEACVSVDDSAAKKGQPFRNRCFSNNAITICKQ